MTADVPQTIRLSVVIATLHREACLCDTIRHFLDAESHPAFELIVIDQSTRHEPETTMFVERHRHRYRHVAVDYQGLPRARNHGVRLATGDVVVFVDDDVRPAAGFLEAHARAYRDPGVVGVAGSVLAPAARQRSRGEIGEQDVERLLRQEHMVFDADFAFPAQWAAGCNMSFRRRAIADVGWFDEAFGSGVIGDDAEFSHRARAIGQICYEPAARLVHLEVPSGGTRDAHSQHAYLRSVGFCTNYFWHRVGATRGDRYGRVWQAFRKRVCNRSALARPGMTLAGLSFWRGVVDAELRIRQGGPPPAGRA